MHTHCRRCLDQRVSWVEQAPDYSHRYRVECTNCHTRIKWGSERDISEALNDPNVRVVSYKEPSFPTLDSFLKSN
jgi:hypothetical protein